MPSNLRLQTTLDTQSTQSYFPTAVPAFSQAKKQKMSLTQTYRIASSARTKLGREASRSDHDLRLLVGHANLLDSLMVELADAEREQEAWFNETLRKSTKPEAPKHVQWIDSIAEEQVDEEVDEDGDEDEDSDSDSAISEDDVFAVQPRRRSVSPPPSSYDYEDEEVFDEDYEDLEDLALTRTQPHPPELVHEDSSDSEDDSMPPSPPQSALEVSSKQQHTALFSKVHSSQHTNVVENDFMVNSSQMIAAY